MLFKGKTIRAFDTNPDYIIFHPSTFPSFSAAGSSVRSAILSLTSIFGLPWHVKTRFRIAIRHAIRSSMKMVCISEFTKRHVMEEFGLAPDHIEVIYPPLHMNDEDEIEGVKRQPPLVNGDYLLYVGNRHVHKNVPCLIDALIILKSDFQGCEPLLPGPGCGG
jgi:hypothetical protein